MGACKSKIIPFGEFFLDEVQTFDIVFMRSKSAFNGFSTDSRVNDCIKGSISGIHIPQVNEVLSFDRIGIIVVPTGIDPFEVTFDNIKVVEATATGIKSQSLRSAFDTASELVIRHVHLPGEIVESRKEKMKKKKQKKKIGTGDDGNLEERKQLDNKRRLLRKNFDNFVASVANEPYEKSFLEMPNMLAWVVHRFKELDVSEEMLDKTHTKVKNLESHPEGADRGLTLEGLLQLMADMCNDPTLENPISDADTAKLVKKFTVGPVMPSGDYINLWKSGKKKHAHWYKCRSPILSGAFVSEVLIRLDLLSHDSYFHSWEFLKLPPEKKKGKVVKGAPTVDGNAIRSLKNTKVADIIRIPLPFDFDF